MAARDRNGAVWQAYVVTVSIVSVLLLVGLFLTWRAWNDAAQKLEEAETKLADQATQFTNEKSKVELMEAMIGSSSFSPEELSNRIGNFENDADMQPLLNIYDQAMNMFGPSVKETEKNLGYLPTYLLETVRARNADLAANRTATAKQRQQLQNTIASETAARVAAQNDLAKTKKDLENLQVEHKKQLDSVNKDRQETIAKFDGLRRDLTAQINTANATAQKLTAENARLSTVVVDLQDKLDDYESPDFAAPQGKIVKVANGSTRVWINLGSEDGLRAGVPFSVIDESELNITNATPKAKIVVSRVVGPHLALCETVELDYANIIVSEDAVYSPAWRAGRKVGFALVGEMDINNDGRDDFDQVRQLIQLAGGKVDAYKSPTGSEGEIDYNTSWLVMGTDLLLPEGASDARRAENAARLKQYADFRKQAKQFGVREIALDKLMGYLKTDSSDRTVPLGSRIRGDDFRTPRGGLVPETRGNVSEIFRPRSPIKQ